MKIADYDKYNYDYEKYWKNEEIDRTYEDLAERMALSKLLPKKGSLLLDLGCGFGRLTDLYLDRFERIILADYSIENLKKAKKRYGNQSKIYFVALNAYHLPFKSNSIETLLLVRVIHHIEDPLKLLSEISRVTNKYFILEYPNKRHFLEIIRALFGKSNMNPFNLNPSKRGELFYNFHPTYISNLLKKTGFEPQKIYSVSNLRHIVFKKILGTKFMLFLEHPLQSLFAIGKLGPSIFLLCQKQQQNKGGKPEFNNFLNFLCCPNCESDFEIRDQNLVCLKCQKNYRIDNGIIDLRK